MRDIYDILQIQQVWETNQEEILFKKLDSKNNINKLIIKRYLKHLKRKKNKNNLQNALLKSSQSNNKVLKNQINYQTQKNTARNILPRSNNQQKKCSQKNRIKTLTYQNYIQIIPTSDKTLQQTHQFMNIKSKESQFSKNILKCSGINIKGSHIVQPHQSTNYNQNMTQFNYFYPPQLSINIKPLKVDKLKRVKLVGKDKWKRGIRPVMTMTNEMENLNISDKKLITILSYPVLPKIRFGMT